jgi:hypothetical protein
MTENPPPDVPEADVVRADIAATRAELADTVDALTSKLDVKARASDKVSEVKQKAAATAERAKQAAPPPVQHALNAAGEKAAPVVHRVSTSAAPHRGKIAAGVVALVIAVLTLRRRKRGEPT